MAEKITVELCMGSSCFARGNSEVLQAMDPAVSHAATVRFFRQLRII